MHTCYCRWNTEINASYRDTMSLPVIHADETLHINLCIKYFQHNQSRRLYTVASFCQEDNQTFWSMHLPSSRHCPTILKYCIFLVSFLDMRHFVKRVYSVVLFAQMCNLMIYPSFTIACPKVLEISSTVPMIWMGLIDLDQNTFEHLSDLIKNSGFQSPDRWFMQDTVAGIITRVSMLQFTVTIY